MYATGKKRMGGKREAKKYMKTNPIISIEQKQCGAITNKNDVREDIFNLRQKWENNKILLFFVKGKKKKKDI